MKLSLKNPIDEFKPKIREFFKNIPKEVPEIPFDEIPKKGKFALPSGGYGEAYLSDDKTRAVKIINLNRHFSDKIISSLQNEIVNYHRISTLCPKYFCKFIGYSYSEQDFVVAIVMENCGTDLLEFFNSEIDEKYRLKYLAAENNNRDVVEEIDIEKMSKLNLKGHGGRVKGRGPQWPTAARSAGPAVGPAGERRRAGAAAGCRPRRAPASAALRTAET